jgi:hypothetical protein
MPKFKKKQDYEIETFTKEYYKRLAAVNEDIGRELIKELDALRTWRGFLAYQWRKLTRRLLGR